MAHTAHTASRLAELLAAEAAGSIDHAEQAELHGLLGENPTSSRDRTMTVAGLAQLAFLKEDRSAQAAMPDSLRQRLAVQASAWNAGRHAVAAAPVVDLTAARRQRERKPVAGSNPTPAWWRSTSAGWAAAAALAVAFVIAQRAPDATRSPPVVAVESQRNALLDQATDLVTVPWGPSGEPGYENASGDVVWSNARQEGYLRIRGLPINDRAQAQYQLWIVDASRDVHPVDGGVFDITINGELIIPVRAKLPLNRPGAFAVTLEKPGGVVVSDGPMLLVAAVQT